MNNIMLGYVYVTSHLNEMSNTNIMNWRLFQSRVLRATTTMYTVVTVNHAATVITNQTQVAPTAWLALLARQLEQKQQRHQLNVLVRDFLAASRTVGRLLYEPFVIRALQHALIIGVNIHCSTERQSNNMLSTNR